MRIILTFIFVVTYAFSFSQRPLINKLWVGDANNYLKVDTDAVRIECYYDFQGKKNVTKRAYRYFLIGDTLRVVESELSSSSNHDFIIETLSKDELKLVALNSNSRILALTEIPRKVLSFRAQQKVYTDTISFQEILFSSTTCYGMCPAMSFQIDNKKQMKFSGDKFAVKQGFYTAILSDQLYSELLKILAISELDKLENYGDFNIDAPTYTLEVHYNDKVKFIKSSFLPYVTNKLLTLLLEIPKQVELKEAKQMEISFSSK
jgi:hypothetical protein